MTKKRNIRRPQQFEESKVEGYFMISRRDALIAVTNKLTGSQLRLWIYLITIDPHGEDRQIWHSLPSSEEIGLKIGASSRAVEKDMRRLSEVGLWKPYWPQLRIQNNIEQRVRNHLQSRLGGLTEVTTAVGRIDLLTDTEIIEVKEVDDWKHAMGQVLAYSGFYPEHKKRIHLFAHRGNTSPEYALLQAKSICNGLDIIVTFEEVE